MPGKEAHQSPGSTTPSFGDVSRSEAENFQVGEDQFRPGITK